MTENTFRIDWMQVGKEHWEGQKERIQDIIDRMDWDYDFRGKSVAMTAGLAINEIIKEMKMPRVTAVSYNSHEMAPFGIYGIEANYKNARIRLIVVDEGSCCNPICTLVWPKA